MNDVQIAQEASLQHIDMIGAGIGLGEQDLIHFGPYKAKISYEAVQRILSQPKRAKLVLVSAITPTAAGEGKTTTSIGLTQGLSKIGKKSIVALREPSLGPVFGVKGGATGGGYSQVLPMEDINLHFTGDLHAVTAAHNLIAAAVDNSIHFLTKKTVSVRNVLWKRVMDMNDRSLRDIVIGLGPKNLPRESGFDITAASEVMAILCLSMNYHDLKEKIANILLGFTEDKDPVTVGDLGIQGAVAALLKEALLPNLVQTLEGGPALIHGGPFANIAQGANSVLATNLGLRLADFCITEAGFGFDLGAEKFFDIVSPYGGFFPDCVVLVATVRALKLHGGVSKKVLNVPNAQAVARGIENLEKHLENISRFGVKAVVALNRFPGDTDDEIRIVSALCEKRGVEFALSSHWQDGGEGAKDLAEKVAALCNGSSSPAPKTLYDWKASPEEKISTVARQIYGAEAVDYTGEARADLKLIKSLGYEGLPVCIAKTQSSLSDNPKLLGRPKDFLVTVRRIIISAGAGFLVPLTGDIMRMPGLPRVPAAEQIDIDDSGNITGLF
ncbi:MAG: formate--tetrahydrofolate ligase [Spirochaetales bacterium]|nr:formate--tetrahydrofolate ligase [Spirochaetales bacterium]